MKTIFFALLCFFTFLPTLGSEFKFDDYEYIDPSLGHHYSSLLELFSQSKNLHYNPLNYLFNDILFSLWGHQHAWPFHLVNIVLFFLNVLFLYKIAALLTKSESAAVVAAVLFCLHPINAEMVNQVVFNTVLVSALCVQAVILIFDRYLAAPSARKMLAALTVSLIAILTLETSMILPFYLFCWAYFVRGRNFRNAVTDTLGFWILAGALFLTWFFVSCGSTLPGDVLPRFRYLNLTPLTFIGSLISLSFWYLQKLMVPVGHVWIYGMQPLDLPRSLSYLVVLLVIAISAYSFRRKIFASAGLNFLLIWFFAGFIFSVPGSFAHPENGLVIEPYWFYVSSMGFFILLGSFLSELKNKINRSVFWVLLASICFVLALLTQRFNVIAKTQKSYSDYWFKTSENSIALTTLAKMTYDENNYTLAAQYYELYLARFAGSPYSRDHADRIYTNLGAIYVEMGDIPKAKAMISQALKLAEHNSRTDTVCGVISFKEKDYTQAEEYFNRAIASDLTNVLNRFNLVELYLQTGRRQKAARLLEEMEKMPLSRTERISVLSKLAVLQFLRQDKDSSMSTIERLLKADSSAAAYLGLARTFFAAGELEPSRIFLDQGLKMYPHEKELQVFMAETVSRLANPAQK